METIVLFVVAALFFVLLSLNSYIREHLTRTRTDLLDIQMSLNEIINRLNKLDGGKVKEPSTHSDLIPSAAQAAKAPFEEQSLFERILETVEEPEHVEESIEEPVEIPLPEEKIEVEVAKENPIVSQPKEDEPTIETPIPTTKKEKTFFEKNPDLEKFIGENLMNKIGIIILVLGLGFLVKYAIDKNWINEIGRVAIGIACAGGLLGIAHKLRKDYKPFSSVLIGGGLALLYFTITLAYHTAGYPLYQMQTIAFIILIFITLFAVFLSIVYDRVEIAVLAILGGFGSPFMVSNGTGNYVVLFSYLMLLNVGMLVLSYHKKWRLINIVSFVFTMLLFSTWLSSEIVSDHYSSFNGALFFAIGFYVIFFLMNIIYNIKNKIDFLVGDILLLLSNTFLFFTFMMIMLTYINDGAYKGLCSVLLGAYNFGFAYYIHQTKKADANLLYLLIALVLTFVTLAIPLQLNGNYITLFWAMESLLLLWLSQKSGFKIMQLGSLIIVGLTCISLTMDWLHNYTIYQINAANYVKQLGFVVNKMFITTLVAGGALVASSILLKKERDDDEFAWLIPLEDYKSMVFGLTLVLFYVGGLLEVIYQSKHFFIESSSQTIAVVLYNALYLLGLHLLAYKQNRETLSQVVLGLSVLFVVHFLFAISNSFSDNILTFITDREPLSRLLLIFRWTSILAAYIITLRSFKLMTLLNTVGEKVNTIRKMATTFVVFVIIYLLSADLDAIAVLISKNRDILGDTHKTGYAILWAISSFVLMLIGMKKKQQIIRVLSLSLFAITIAKLFIYDISNISEGGKIVAFILLGVLLLIMSFMYQKLKKLIVDENKTKEDDSIIDKM
jgi:uncharacterized membrane protein